MRSFFFLLPAIVFCYFISLSTAVAQSSAVYLPTDPDFDLPDRSVFDTLVLAAEFLASLIGILAILAIMISGILYIVSGGNLERTTMAKNMLTYAVLGLVVALLAWVIVYSVSQALGA